MQSLLRTIVIVGGGFSGSVLATKLLRHPPSVPTRIILIERRDRIGCGVAYAPRSYPYLLNVPAGRMSIAADDPTQLVRFAQRHVPGADAESFLPRHIYGEYVRHMLQAAQVDAPRYVHLERVHGQVTAIQPVNRSGSMLVTVGERRLLADQVVLACGAPSSSDKAYATEVAGHAAYVRDPHHDECIHASDQTVLLIGSGLTMMDVAVAAATRNPSMRIFAVSRHGLLPAAQRDAALATVLDAGLDLHARLSGGSVRRLCREVRTLARMAHQRGGDWREVITRVRDLAPALWHALDATERGRFLRHVRAYWDIHRHRAPPAMALRLDELRRSGRLQVRAGCIQQLCAERDRIVALWRPRGHLDTREMWVDRVVECTGADHRLEGTRDPLLRHLLDTRLICPDSTGLGLRTAEDGALIDADGRTAGRLFYLGPMLRADHWEATAVGELRARADALAARLGDGGQDAAAAGVSRGVARGAYADDYAGAAVAPPA
jgi:uncharacterized NAD(P)/FAD-binding protein YdhS